MTPPPFTPEQEARIREIALDAVAERQRRTMRVADTQAFSEACCEAAARLESKIPPYDGGDVG
ncbi:MAG: hypothetical protein ABIV36_10215 [Sphingobium limneticum]